MSESKTNGEQPWETAHRHLNENHYLGVHGGSNAAYHGLAGLRDHVDMANFHTKRSPDEYYIPSLDSLLKDERTRRRWNDVVTFDPMGMYADHPTMAATESNLNFPELPDLHRDGKIVNKDGSIRVCKVGIEYAWDLPRFSERIKLKEKDVRKALHDYTKIEGLTTETDKRVFMPPVGGMTVYFIGDPSKLANPETEVAVRVHDECNGSDVFGTDICTCRPYLVFAMKACVDTAQRGGVGVIVYFRKEGRSLGEVTKYRVYNARKAQDGGDRPEKYFYQTESIAGVRDARFQEMMPDVLLWLGIERIDWLLSMSSEKYDAITELGIKVQQRVALPDSYVPAGAHVEINAKISAGYQTNKMDEANVVGELRQLQTIRTRTGQVYDLVAAGKGTYFDLDEKAIETCADFVVDVTKKNYPDLSKIPYHSRWRHFPAGVIEKLEAAWPCNDLEKVRRLIDLVTVSVLLDAGAGDGWKFLDNRQQVWSRSEGIAVATLDMFTQGLFSSDVCVPHRVNSVGLQNMTLAQFARGFQHSEENPIVGLESRFKMMQSLAKALKSSPQFFGHEVCRPGNVVDYVLRNAGDNKRPSINVLWKAIIEGLEAVWPDKLAAIQRGDIWVYNPLKEIGKPGSDMVPFHKLSQWLTYSMLEPLQKAGIEFGELELLTGLAEYRNGGLFIDTGVITLKDAEAAERSLDIGSELIVEWRALTLQLLDRLHVIVCKKLNLTKEQFPLAKLLQGGTWAAGRVIAREKRPATGGPPIKLRSDGSVF